MNWVKEKMGRHSALYHKDTNPMNRDGICIQINKNKKSITISAWYDTCVGIEPRTISLEELLSHFQVKEAHNGK